MYVVVNGKIEKTPVCGRIYSTPEFISITTKKSSERTTAIYHDEKSVSTLMEFKEFVPRTLKDMIITIVQRKDERGYDVVMVG